MILSISYLLYFHITQAEFPIERDVAELVGVSPPKQWIVFVEKLMGACLNGITTKESSGITDIIWCMIKKNASQSLHGQHSMATIIHRYPNILHAESNLRLQIIVHYQFNLNVTVMYYFDEYGLAKMGVLYLMISGKRYTKPHYPFTFMSSSNSIEMLFHSDIDFCIGVEYSIGQRFNLTNDREMQVNGMYFRWGNFQVTCFRIHVNMRARLALIITSCLRRKFIVYDGPTGKLPIIMKSKGTRGYQRVVASTFQVFVVLIEDIDRQETVITFSPIYINRAVYDLTYKDHVEVSFDNHTNCHGYSLYARLCVFAFYTSRNKTILFSLNDLIFSGKYSGSQSEAGVVIFNHFNGTTEKLVKLNSDLESYKYDSDFEIIGTGSMMHISVFDYFLLSSITLRFTMSTGKCNTFLASDTHISYSEYIKPVLGKSKEFQINQLSQALPQYNVCHRFQFIYMKPSKYKPFKFTFPVDVNPMLVKEGYNALHPLRYPGCLFNSEQPMYYLNKINTTTTDELNRIFFINSFEVNLCGPLQYTHLEIEILPCKIPCQHIIQEKFCFSRNLEPNVTFDDSFSSTCDICKNIYLFCNIVPLPSNILPLIQIKSKVCRYATLIMWTREPILFRVLFVFNRSDAFSALPEFKTPTYINLRSTSCVIEIPTYDIALLNPNMDWETTRHIVKSFHWGGTLYRSIYQHIAVSWEAAASYCLGSGASLLTIHSEAEYQFVTDTFLKSYDFLVLYVGVQRKVIYL